MMKVILDTNFLIDCAKFRIDYIEELKRIMYERYSIYVIDATFVELKNVKKAKVSAKLAISMARKLGLKVIKTKKDKIVDELILEKADSAWLVGTQDANLKRKLKNIGVSRLFIRQKRYLAISSF